MHALSCTKIAFGHHLQHKHSSTRVEILLGSQIGCKSTKCILKMSVLQNKEKVVCKTLCTSEVCQEDIFWQKNKSFQKKPIFVFTYFKEVKLSPIESADSWAFESTQWNILSLFHYIFTKLFHCALKCSAVSRFGLFEIQTNMGFFWKDMFFCQKTSSWNTFNMHKVLSTTFSLFCGLRTFLRILPQCVANYIMCTIIYTAIA